MYISILTFKLLRYTYSRYSDERHENRHIEVDRIGNGLL
jgi:hypothetical protein